MKKILEIKHVLYLLCGSPRPAWLAAEGNQPAACLSSSCLARVAVRGDSPARARIEGEPRATGSPPCRRQRLRPAESGLTAAAQSAPCNGSERGRLVVGIQGAMIGPGSSVWLHCAGGGGSETAPPVDLGASGRHGCGGRAGVGHCVTYDRALLKHEGCN